MVQSGRDGSIPTGRGPLSIPVLELFTGECALPPEFTVAGTARCPTSAMGVSAISPGVAEVSESPKTAEVPPPDLTWQPTA